MNKKTDYKFDIEDSVDYMQEYWNTYKDQYEWKQYDQETFLNDALFGICISMDLTKEHDGRTFEKFKVFLYNRFDSLVKTLFLNSLKRGR